VQVGDRTFEARRGVVLATGTRPRDPPPGLETVEYWTKRGVENEKVPASLVVLGGGAVGLGSPRSSHVRIEVTIVERSPGCSRGSPER